MNATTYGDILSLSLVPFINQTFHDGQRLYQDNDPNIPANTESIGGKALQRVPTSIQSRRCGVNEELFTRQGQTQEHGSAKARDQGILEHTDTRGLNQVHQPSAKGVA